MALGLGDVRRFFGEFCTERGRQRYANQHVKNVRWRAGTVEGACRVNLRRSEFVTILLDGASIADATCSCPAGGRCQHAAGVAYAFLAKADDAPAHRPIRQRLESRSKARLVEIVTRYAEGRPDFRAWLEGRLQPQVVPLPSVDRHEVERRVHGCITRWLSNDYHDSDAWVADLRDIVQPAREFLRAERPDAVLEVCVPVFEGLQEALEEPTTYRDHCAGLLCDVLGYLCDALRVAEAADVRASLIDALWESCRWDVEQHYRGHYGPVATVLVRETDADERRELADRARSFLQKLEGRNARTDTWKDAKCERVGWLLCGLARDWLDDDELLELTERTDNRQWWVDEHVRRGNPEAALDAALDLLGQHRLEYVDRFIEAGRDDLAERLLHSVLESGDYTKYDDARSLLTEFYVERSKWEKALEQARRRYRSRPDRQKMREVRRIARQAGCWEEIEADVLNTMGDRSPRELIWHYVDVQNADAALAIWEATDLRFHFDHCEFLGEIGKMRPERAKELLLERARYLIDRRGRDNYQEASECLVRVRDICLKADREQRWKQLEHEFRSGFRNLPAFQDEFRKAGLRKW